MIPEFKTKPGNEYAIAKTGGFDLLISPKRWILRIGAIVPQLAAEFVWSLL
jgi:hypothetical protein